MEPNSAGDVSEVRGKGWTTMPTGSERASIWLAKAEEAQALAARITEPQAQLAALKIAEAYIHRLPPVIIALWRLRT
jgi:hypothetical protein